MVAFAMVAVIVFQVFGDKVVEKNNSLKESFLST
jgi:hypothetical protein